MNIKRDIELTLRLSAVFPSINPAEANDFRLDLNIFARLVHSLSFSLNVAFLRNALGFYTNQFRAKNALVQSARRVKGTKMQNEPKFSHFEFLFFCERIFISWLRKSLEK